MNVSTNYIVFSEYYKHGENEIDIFSSEEELREHIKEWFEDAQESYDDEDFEVPNTQTCDINKLIKLVVKEGKKYIEDERGWGITRIIVCKGVIELIE